MTEVLPIIILVLLAVTIAIQVVSLVWKASVDLTPVRQALDSIDKSYERTERAVREEIVNNREEAVKASRHSREELSNTLKGVGDTICMQLDTLTKTTDGRLNRMRDTLEQRLDGIQEESSKKLDQVREDSQSSARSLRDEVGKTLKDFGDSLVKSVGAMAELEQSQLEVFSTRLDKLTETNEHSLSTIRDTVEQRLQLIQGDSGKKLDRMREEFAAASEKARIDLATSLKEFSEMQAKTTKELGENQRLQLAGMFEQLARLTDSNQAKLDALRMAVEAKLKEIQEDNAKQLDQMRLTVDERLQGTLDKRLGESFKQVSERLEQVYKGLGEMRTLATGVGDLKKVLTNVKTRGTWGEVQLGALLEQVLTIEQYATNVATKEGGERVEYAIQLPGRSQDDNEVVWLPIDAKFPMEDYQRLIDAQEKVDVGAAEDAAKQLENRIKLSASDICKKYLNPPKTTDFGILFLPTEGLFAEVIRRPGLAELIQREYRVVIAGPTTLWSILNSLQMGFRTLAIQKRSSEVWNLLSAVKTEWSNYGTILEKVQKKLSEASNTVEQAHKRTRAIGRKLKDVQALPAVEAKAVLMVEEE